MTQPCLLVVLALDTYIHVHIGTYINTYIHIHIHTHIPTYLPTLVMMPLMSREKIQKSLVALPSLTASSTQPWF